MIVTPQSLGGTPQAVPTNNWWAGAAGAIESSAKVLANTATGLATSYASVLSTRRLVSSGDVAGQNRPPGTFGVNPQAAGVPGAVPEGGAADMPGSGAISPGVVLAAALLVGFLLLVKAR